MSGYDEDILAWSERQSTLLRRIAAGERVNDTDLDWPNIAEEIESVGRSELRACGSLLVQALLHQFRVWHGPTRPPCPAGRKSWIRFRQEAADAYAPSMRQHLNLDRLYRRALQRLPKQIDGQPPLPVPQTCPLTLDELLSE